MTQISGVSDDAPPTAPWWKEATIYQIYPASFLDSNGDGLGDLPGIVSKLDYLKALQVDCLWISPFFTSPQKDQGYDISDYQDVDPPYGSLKDVDAIIKGCHERDIRVLFDLVINHCSDLHPWFIESRSSKTNSKRDWFFWKPPTYIDGVRHPPNNWKACFGGSVWEWDELTQEYFLHYYAKEQPDFNWENPETREALYQEAIVFWLEKGVDGFRIDTVNKYSKHLDFPDAPFTDLTSPWQQARGFFNNGPRIHEFIKEMKEKAFEKYGALALAEFAGLADHTKVLPFVKASSKELDIAIQFNLALIDEGPFQNLLYVPWTLQDFKRVTLDAQQLIEPRNDAWSVTCLENHDLARCVSRFANDEPEWRVQSAKMLATYLLTLSGTPIIYQGQELGMINIDKSWPLSEYKDVMTVGFWADIVREARADPSLLKRGLHGIQLLARDHARTPMQWTSEAPHGGFSTSKGQTWMKANEAFATINAADQESDPNSPLAFYRSLLTLRKKEKELFIWGTFELLDADGKETFVFLKHDAKENVMVVALNFTKIAQTFKLPIKVVGRVKLAMSTLGGDSYPGQLGPFEARIYLPL
ncbi:hypothetical protein P7C70_g7628, partial [Phenoliferia sp. Uapishka_3]